MGPGSLIDNDKGGSIIVSSLSGGFGSGSQVSSTGCTFNNYGTFNVVEGWLIVGGGSAVTLNNYGSINNAWGMRVNSTGVLTNENGGSITVKNGGHIGNWGTLANYGTIDNSGLIDNYETIDNGGTILNECGATFVNSGTLQGNAVAFNLCCVLIVVLIVAVAAVAVTVAVIFRRRKAAVAPAAPTSSPSSPATSTS
jgi:hypothetical protein